MDISGLISLESAVLWLRVLVLHLAQIADAVRPKTAVET